MLLFLVSKVAPAQSTSHEQQQECFMLLVGKNASADGTVLLAHNNDLSGTEKSHIVKHQRQVYGSTDSITFPSGLTIPQADTTWAWLSLEIERGYAEGDAVAINEFGVAIAGGVALKPDRNKKAIIADPLVNDGVTGGIRYVALQRAKSARECVKILGAFYTSYGVTYPSGVGVADTSVIWFIESGGGHSWAAVRVPDSCYWAQANGYRISYINPNDTLNYYCSPDLLGFCKQHRLWVPDGTEFDFSAAFGGGRRESNEKSYYDTRRIWRCQNILNPELKLSSDLDDYPDFLAPNEKITLKKCFDILRDRYEGTAFENQVDDRGIDGERPIASWNAVHTDVIQLHPGMETDDGAILWAGIGAPQTTCYIPYIFGVEEIHPAFGNEIKKELSAFAKFREFSVSAKGKNISELEQRKVFDRIEAEAVINTRMMIRNGNQKMNTINLEYSERVMNVLDANSKK